MIRHEARRTRELAAVGPENFGDLAPLVALALPHASTATRRTMAEQADVRRFDTGTVAYHQAESRPFGIIAAGHAALRRTTPGGRQLVPRLAGRGRIVGISGLVGRVASNDVVALTPLEVAIWTPALVRGLAEADAGLGLDLLEHTIAMSRELWEQLDALIYQDARARVARVLAAHVDLLFGTPPEIPRAQIAELVGTSREMTRRVLRSLEQDRIVERVGTRGLRLTDESALRDVARRVI
ncbi:MAG TPA: Crp/Fnr family transcriptional regulator [Candidatus Limnocylindrales bacterium]